MDQKCAPEVVSGRTFDKVPLVLDFGIRLETPRLTMKLAAAFVFDRGKKEKSVR
ncbi:MAG: hypothetical protein AB1781_00025 [Pseudomonadota bacterium]